MALKKNVLLRNAQLDVITTFASTNCLVRIYDGSQPATGGTATNLLAELTISGALAAAAASGVLTLGTITQDSSANASGTATWFRIVKSDGTTHVFDGTVGTSGADLNLVTTTIVATQPVQVSSFTITAGNA